MSVCVCVRCVCVCELTTEGHAVNPLDSIPLDTSHDRAASVHAMRVRVDVVRVHVVEAQRIAPLRLVRHSPLGHTGRQVALLLADLWVQPLAVGERGLSPGIRCWTGLRVFRGLGFRALQGMGSNS